MSSASDHTDDPLYEPTFIAFIYAGWIGSTWLLGEWPGLVVLVASTGALTAWALRQHHDPAPRRFVVDFGVVLLFCAAAIALGVLVIAGIAAEPALFFGVLCLGLAALLVAMVLRDERGRVRPD